MDRIFIEKKKGFFFLLPVPAWCVKTKQWHRGLAIFWGYWMVWLTLDNDNDKDKIADESKL